MKTSTLLLALAVSGLLIVIWARVAPTDPAMTPEAIATAKAERAIAAEQRRDAEMQQLIAEHKITVGMTPAQVEASRGKPRRIYTEGGAGDQIEAWQYSSDTLYFLNGKLLRWSRTTSP